MTPTRLFAAAAVAALIAMPAMAQDSMPPADPNEPATAAEPMADPMTDTTAVNPPPAPASEPVPVSSPSATAAGTDVAANVTTRTVTNGPIPDTAENRARYGAPLSATGRRSKPAGN